ncbi:hypothetical protein GGR52DRAFT_574804 [Hypoxylon sp. FL1284]|nr:hypothetical protein GGR52DRAFT_574804 [Hypoxylon sp. FL1284]
MAKEKTKKPHKDKAVKAEKKVSQDKVKKHKKEKKPKLEDDPVASDNEKDYIALKDAPKPPAEPSSESPSKASAPKYKDKKERRRKEKKQKKAEKELKKKSKKGAIEAAIAESASNADTPDVDTSNIDTSNTVELPVHVRPASKGSDSSENTDDNVDEDDDADDADEGAPLFAIDVNPSAVVPRVQAERPVSMNTINDEDEHPTKTQPPSGLNRQARRRIRMIEERRDLIRTKLGVADGSTDKADEVQAQLDKWVADFDAKGAARLEKRRMRKAKEAARIRNKRGKLLTGRRLTERKKSLQKMEKKSRREGGLSAPFAAAA